MKYLIDFDVLSDSQQLLKLSWLSFMRHSASECSKWENVRQKMPTVELKLTIIPVYWINNAKVRIEYSWNKDSHFTGYLILSIICLRRSFEGKKSNCQLAILINGRKEKTKQPKEWLISFHHRCWQVYYVN